MVRGSFQRAALSILVMALMLAPFGVCSQPVAKGAHSCCAMQSEPLQSLQNGCCVVKAPLPGGTVAPLISVANPLQLVQQPLMRGEVPLFTSRPAVAVIPPLSPPTGAFILRI